MTEPQELNAEPYFDADSFDEYALSMGIDTTHDEDTSQGMMQTVFTGEEHLNAYMKTSVRKMCDMISSPVVSREEKRLTLFYKLKDGDFIPPGPFMDAMPQDYLQKHTVLTQCGKRKVRFSEDWLAKADWQIVHLIMLQRKLDAMRYFRMKAIWDYNIQYTK